jgi:F0F1-type ATP synthase membrane subunit a
MRAVFIVSFLANVVLAIVSWLILPEQVAIHFGQGGLPDSWASNLTSTFIMLGLHSLVFCSLYFSPKLFQLVPAKWISLPNRQYWLKPEHSSQAIEKFSRHIWQFGTTLFLFMFFLGLLSLKANLSDPVRLDEGPLLSALVIFLAYTGYWSFTLIRSFRIPPEH